MQAQKEPREFDELEKTLCRGELVYPDDPTYALTLRTWNAQALRRPKVVVRARGAADVVATIKYVAQKGLPFAVKAGGHSMTCLSEGLVIDLCLMRSIRLDVERRVVRVDAGCLLGEVDAELAPFGLVVPAGVVSHTGVAGLTLGGGFGYLSRKFGLTCDHLLSVDLVTADGELRVVSPTQNADLFWAMRGAGSIFGVVTSFEFRCETLTGPVFSNTLIFPYPRLAEVGKTYIEATATPERFPRDAYQQLIIAYGPSGQLGVVLGSIHFGDDESSTLEEGKRHVAPFVEIGPVMQVGGGLIPFTRLQKEADQMAHHGRNYYQSAIFTTEVTEELLSLLSKHVPLPGCVIMVEPMGGKVGDLPLDECAVSWRQAKFAINVLAVWDKPEEEESRKAWVRALRNDLKPFKTESTYINMVSVEKQEKENIPVSEWFGVHTARVRELKEKWDPNNLFRSQANLFRGAQ